MSIYNRSAGQFRVAKQVFVKNAGAWVEPSEVYVKQGGSWILTHKTVTISSNTTDANVAVLAGNPTGNVTVTIKINSGVTVSSTSRSTPAITVGGLAPGAVTVIINNGTIRGAGGNGGAGAAYGGSAGAGQQGGTAIQVNGNLYIENASGVIRGGGGGGGGSGYTSVTTSCFPAGTKVLTPAGEKNIEDVQVGDIVLAFDTQGTIVERAVTSTSKHTWEETGSVSPLLIITHEQGVLTTTVNHEIRTPSRQTLLSDPGFARADQLQVGDTIYLHDGTATTITEILPGPAYDFVYNFEVDEVHTYIADNIRVHNGTGGGGKGSSTTTYSGGGGGGGAGQAAGAGGAAGTGGNSNGAAGSAGSASAGGAGGAAQAGAGGTGGAPGSAGANGGGGSGNGTGGAAGYALSGNVNVTWVGGFNLGTIQGPVV